MMIHSKPHPRGFALVITLLMMILLTVVAVSLLSLSSISLRASSQNQAQAQAQANARLALMLALGKLQESLGPDQNITAPSAIFDSDPNTPTNEGLTQHHLTGVWQARKESLSQMPDYSRTSSFRRWLVSNGDDEQLKKPEFVSQGTFINPVPMVESKNSTDGRVEAGRLSVGRGSIAWWVSDENRKAFINPRDIDDRKSVPIAELIAGFATPGAHGVLTLDGFKNFPTNTETSDKLVTAETFAPKILPQIAAVDTGKLFHHISPYPQSVLTNVTSGGLRKDLSLYLERTDINWLQGWGFAGNSYIFPKGPLGPNAKIALSNPDDHDVLAWKHLHHWYHMHRQQLGNQYDLPVKAMDNQISLNPVNNPAWNSGVSRITPMVVRIQMLISLGAQAQAGSSNYSLKIYSYPVVTLWNPYNVPMRVTEWSTFLHTLPLEHTIYKGGIKLPLTGGGTLNGSYNWGWPQGNMTMRVGNPTPAISLAPGEAKTLTYSASQAGGFNAHDMIARPPAWLPTFAGQPRDLGTISGRASDRIAISTSLATWESSSTSYTGQNFQTTFDFRCEPRAIHAGHPERFIQQMFSSQVGWRHEASNPRIAFISQSNFPNLTLGDLNNNPTPFIHLDIRLKTLDEVALPNKTWLHNIPFHPFAAVTSTSKHLGKGVDAATTFFAHPYTITFEQVSGPEGVLQNQPLFGPSNRPPGGQSRIVSAPIPLAPLTSLAQLQNLPLLPIEALNWSGYHLQNHAIANSFASPGLPPESIRETSFPFHIGQYFPWQGGDIAGRMYGDRAAFNSADYVIPGAPALVVDRSYVANHLLFDEYFFSSIAAKSGPVIEKYGSRRTLQTVVDDFFSGRKPLPVAAYRPYDVLALDVGNVVRLLSNTKSPVAYSKVASKLIVDGGFNINSTSVEAWKVILSAANRKRGVILAGDKRLSNQDRRAHVISRNPNPTTNTATEQSRWLGYRELNDEEICQLAEAVVVQVKKRGPFRSIGEFVNRRRSTDVEMAKYGAIQAALDDPKVDINRDYRGGAKEIKAADIASANYKFKEAALGSRYQGTPACINQADILTPISPIMQARSDTFVIRGYGEARSANGDQITARAWCEAVVQRVPDYMDKNDSAELPHDQLKPINKIFGRRFIIKSFRWLPATN